MPLIPSDILAADPKGHGQRPFGYKLWIASEPPASLVPDFWTTGVTWDERAVTLQSVEMGYGPEPYRANFRMVNTSTAMIGRMSTLPIGQFDRPRNGQAVRIWHTDPTISGFPNNGRYVFQGVIVDVNDDNNAQGSSYNVQAVSNIVRLNEQYVSFSANLLNDPINPSPRFDANGQVYSRLKTLREIVADIMAFKDAWNRPTYFTYASIDWNGLENDPRCGEFIPSNVQFNNTPKGRALFQLLQSAGNFTFCHVILPNGTEKIKIVELNLKCNKCGDKWDLHFLPPGSTSAYGPEHEIETDSTQWSSGDSANTCRVTMAPIRFYTGHFIIPERIDEGNDALNRNCITVEKDTAEQQMDRAVGLDGVFYRFTMPAGTSEDARAVRQYYVGVPMFPAWNPHEDFQPELMEITSAKFPEGKTTINGLTEEDYRGTYEFQMFSVADSIARGAPSRNHMNNLRVYEAWYAPNPCPACLGSGLVSKVYKNEENEPAYDFYAIPPSGDPRKLGTNEALPSGNRMMVQVNNFIFDPNLFGTQSIPSGLVPFPSGNEYPLPWKNLCPYCRGTGRNPQYRIRNIQGTLFQGRATAVAPSGGAMPSGSIAGGEIYLDPDRVQTGPETWEQATNRINVSQPPIVQVEIPLSTDRLVLPKYQYRNKSWQTIRQLPDLQARNRFKHPLQFTKLHRIWSTASDASNPEDKIVPDSWGSYVPFTTVSNLAPDHRIDHQMGTIIFSDPIFVPCRKEISTYQMVSENRYMVDNNGKLVTRTPGRGQITADRVGQPTGYWRPARVWLQAFYTRDNFYDYLYTTPNNIAIPFVTFEATDPEGVVQEYNARASVHDGRLAIEIIKKVPEPTEAGGSDFPTGNRPIQVCISEETLDVEMYPDDLYKQPVVPTSNTDYTVIEAEKKNANLQFTRGRIFIYTRTTPGEVELEMRGYENVGFKNSSMRPRIFSASLKDHRPRALQRGVRALESTNDLMVSGQLLLNNFTNNFTNGLGWVQHPNGRAQVKRVTLQYQQGFKVRIDLGRERARAGETLPNDAERMNKIEVQLQAFMRSQRATQATQRRETQNYNGNPNGGVTGFNGPLEG